MVPVIDFSNQNLKAGSPEWDLVKSQVREALEEYGCFEALFDPILELRKAVFGALQEVFDLPLQTKKLFVSDKPFRGYYCNPSAVSVFQSMAVDDAHIAENIEQCLTTSLWPQGNISFRLKNKLILLLIYFYYSKLIINFLIIEMDKIFNTGFGLEKYMDELTDTANYQLRIMKYEKPNTNEQTMMAPAHRDQNMMTLLYQDEVNGLEIQNKDGEWMNMKLSPSTFIVMIGECLSVWLNGRLPSPYHRVMMKGNEDRYSLGLFSSVREGYVVKVPIELVDDKNPMLFKPHDHEEYLKILSSEIANVDFKSGVDISQMSSKTQAMVPVIDFSNQNLKAGSPEWDLVKSQVREALEEYGCFEALFDPILELRKAVFGALQEVFDLPSQTKKLKTLASFGQLTSELEKKILKMILESFGLEKYMDELTDTANYQLRIMKYEKPNTNQQTMMAPAHCDQNMMTLLYQDEVNGLEIQNKDGEWMNMKLSPSSFIVMIGECLSVWLNGRLSSPYHRVMMKGNEDRYSLGLFSDAREGYIVKVPIELVDDKNPMLFKPHDHEEYLKILSSEIAKVDFKSGIVISRLKAYCSV
ncbi:putative 2-oxoglutarate-dependent dioxygenase AOP1 [Gossypium australe]|uniref:Putative 2-oxoglutarate-dependent dioxygenase AOP1 n=1 Tax=Gossypium australe TaxID=47621 RepID=A0A5B6U903_9ROSI|nr:putative 2-oxoglutarate-dependent dioxygenase AOP1 [Gossypium australe]